MNIDCNAIRGNFMHEIVDTTIQEIHDNLVTVFGPYATDAYITKNQQPYFTRDGKEVLASMTFSNPLSMYILKIIYQAVYDQGKRVGDGTTTLAVLYTNLFRILRENDVNYISREDWNDAVKEIVKEIKTKAVPMDDEKLKSVLMTCTQDIELASKIYHNLRNAILDQAYIIINKSNIDTDFQMTVHNSPLIKVTKQFSIRPINHTENRCVVLHCNGMLDIAHVDVLLSLINRTPGYYNSDNLFIPMPKTVILLCNGMTDATRRTTKELIRILNEQSVDTSNFNNLAIYTLTDYRSYSADQIEDISTIFTDEDGIGGLVNQLTFESLLYQAFGDPHQEIPELKTFDCDLHHIDKIRSIFENDTYQIEFDDVAGMRVHKPFGPVAQKRYDDLRKDIEDEKSEVRKAALNKRLRTMYGQFIEVEVGSALMKDSQRKYELILDAVLSTSEGVESGVLESNSLLIAASVISDLFDSAYNKHDIADSVKMNIYQYLFQAIQDTMLDMIHNGWDLDDDFNFKTWIKDKELSKFDLTRPIFTEVLPAENIHLVPEHQFTTVTVDDEEIKIKNQIVEPVSIITTMLTNSTLVMELAKAKTFHVDNFIGNYLQTTNYHDDTDDKFVI